MIFEDLKIKDDYFKLTNSLLNRLKKDLLLSNSKLVIGICGESGSGKSITAMCLQRALKKQNRSSIILHQDSYYKLSPKENNKKRKADLNWVGPHEVNMVLLQEHLNAFKSNQEMINAPVVDYKKNSFQNKEISLIEHSILIVEGVYTFFLDNLDSKIFLERTYKETIDNRKSRTREVYHPFVESVLDIEHNIIKQLNYFADIRIDNTYRVIL